MSASAMLPPTIPPGPHGLPLVGSLFELKRDPLAFLMRQAKEFGDIVNFRIGSKNVYQVNHPDFVREVLVTQHHKLRKTGLMKQASEILGNGLFQSEGEFHRRQRRLVQPAFARPQVPHYAPAIVEIADARRDLWKDGQALDLCQEMQQLTLAVVARTLFNIDLAHEAKGVEGAMTEVLQYFQRFLAPSSGLVSKLPIPRNVRFWAARRYLDGLVTRIISESRARTTQQDDVLSILLRARDDEGDGKGMTDTQVRDEVMTLLIAGHETVATTMNWVWYCLSQNPEAERRFHEEIDSVLAGRLPTADDLPNLKYTEMVVAESMRLFPPVWGMSRRVFEEMQVGSYTIPAGAVVGVSQYVAHHDERFFPDAERFDPLRFTDDERAKRPRFAYFPFGGGPRLCLGEPLAWMESILLLATLGQRWRLELAQPYRLELLPMITLRPKNGMPMICHARREAVNDCRSPHAACA